MATVVIMPKQGQSVESCILTEFKKKKGDTVAVGDILFAYETDKASFEEAAQVAGTVLDVFFDNGGRNTRADQRHGDRQRRRVHRPSSARAATRLRRQQTARARAGGSSHGSARRSSSDLRPHAGGRRLRQLAPTGRFVARIPARQSARGQEEAVNAAALWPERALTAA